VRQRQWCYLLLLCISAGGTDLNSPSPQAVSPPAPKISPQATPKPWPDFSVPKGTLSANPRPEIHRLAGARGVLTVLASYAYAGDFSLAGLLGSHLCANDRPHVRINLDDRRKKPVQPVLLDQRVMQDQTVDARGEKTVHRIGRRFDDRLSLDVE
jgi:hypothetical protein